MLKVIFIRISTVHDSFDLDCFKSKNLYSSQIRSSECELDLETRLENEVLPDCLFEVNYLFYQIVNIDVSLLEPCLKQRALKDLI